MIDFSKYPHVKQIMESTGATIEEIYEIVEKIEGSEAKHGTRY